MHFCYLRVLKASVTGLQINECSKFVEQSFEQKVNWQRAQLNGVQPYVVGLIKKSQQLQDGNENFKYARQTFNVLSKQCQITQECIQVIK